MSVRETALAALYTRLGFGAFGVLPRAIRVDGRYFAKVHMNLRLR